MNNTINYLPNRLLKKGSKIESVNFNELNSILPPKDTIKDNLPALVCYSEDKRLDGNDEFSANYIFMDIDTTYGIDNIIKNHELLFNQLPYIVAMQQSASGKLHLFCKLKTPICNTSDFIKYAQFYLLKVAKELPRFAELPEDQYNYYFGKNNNGQDILDTHNINFYQLFYLSSNEVYYNEYPLEIGDEFDLFNEGEYNSLLKLVSNKNGYTNDNKVCIENNYKLRKEDTISLDKYDIVPLENKIKCDKFYEVGEFNGNEVRWRIANVLHHMYGRDTARIIIKALFSNYNEFKPDYKYGIKREFVDHVHGLLSLVLKKKTSSKDNLILLSDTEYLSDKCNDIKNFIMKNNRGIIKAPTGTGKTTMLGKITKNIGAEQSLIIVPFNATNNLYNNYANVVSSKNKNSWSTDKTNCMVWDQVEKYEMNITNQIKYIFIDESHTLSGNNFREAGLKLFKFLKTFTGSVFFISATPSVEEHIFNCNKIEFIRNEKRKVEVKKCFTTKPVALMSGVAYDKSNDFDYVCIFSDRFATTINSEFTKFMTVNPEFTCVDLYHKGLNESGIERLCSEEILVNKFNIFTQIAFNGLNIRNKGKFLVIVDYDYTFSWNLAVQCIGRFRNADEILVLLVEHPNRQDIGFENEIKLDQELYHKDDWKDETFKEIYTLVENEIIEQHTNTFIWEDCKKLQWVFKPYGFVDLNGPDYFSPLKDAFLNEVQKIIMKKSIIKKHLNVNVLTNLNELNRAARQIPGYEKYNDDQLDEMIRGALQKTTSMISNISERFTDKNTFVNAYLSLASEPRASFNTVIKKLWMLNFITSVTEQEFNNKLKTLVELGAGQNIKDDKIESFKDKLLQKQNTNFERLISWTIEQLEDYYDVYTKMKNDWAKEQHVIEFVDDFFNFFINQTVGNDLNDKKKKYSDAHKVEHKQHKQHKQHHYKILKVSKRALGKFQVGQTVTKEEYCKLTNLEPKQFMLEVKRCMIRID